MSYYLGISSLDCDATISIVKDGKLVYAAQEERFSRVKQQDGFPYKAIENAFQYLNITIEDIEAISYGWFDPDGELSRYKESGKKVVQQTGWNTRPFLETLRNRLNLFRRSNFINHKAFQKYNDQLQEGLQRIGYQKELERYHHQDCHAASAWFTAGFDKALIFTLDGYGSGACGGVFLGEGNDFKVLKYIESPQSLGIMYARVTKALGFRPNRHEGKILGLAAYGQPIFFEEIMADFELSSDGYRYHNSIDPFKYKRLFKNGKAEDLASSFQKVLEVVVCHMVKQYVQQYDIHKVCLAGGVAANVKMNQRVQEIEEVEEVFVHPGMADCGIGTGAAFLSARERGEIRPYTLKNVFLGPDYGEADIKEALAKFDFYHEEVEHIEEKAAQLLADGKVVGLYGGRMEYGPRALCHRTILAPTQDDGINKWLNKRLNRTEFMPFAPVTLAEEASNMYHNIDPIRFTANFMTITVDCTEAMKKLSPAAVHIDGTARPQLVNAENNPVVYKILKHYHHLTGTPSLVNTSYNMHEEPIVCSPYDALKAFKDGRLDYLVLGNYLVHANAEKAVELSTENSELSN